jgi:Flp pilus assembly protein TadD
MDEATRRENTPNKPEESVSADPKPSVPTAPNIKVSDRSQFLDRIAARLFSVLKIFIFVLLLLVIIFIITKIYTQQGIVILPFEISNDQNLSGSAIADQLTAQLIQIQRIHKFSDEIINQRTNSGIIESQIAAEHPIGSQEMVVPKSEILEFSMANIGAINMGSNSLDPGKLVVALSSICPYSEPATIIRGSLQKYGSTIVLEAILEGSDLQSWTIRQSIDNEEQIHEMVINMSFMIAHDLPQSKKVSAKTWEGLKNYTEALDAYHQYKLSRSPSDLSKAGNYSLRAISSEKGYKKPFDLLLSLESIYANMKWQNYSSYYCSKTIDADPTSAYGWENKGLAFAGNSNYSEALKAFEKAIQQDSNYARAWNGKGLALRHEGNNLRKQGNGYKDKSDNDKAKISYAEANETYDEAIKACDKAIELDPTYADPWNSKGITLDYLGRFDEAIKAYDNATRIDPEHVQAWINKGRVLIELADDFKAEKANDEANETYDEAIKACDKAIELDSNSADPWNCKCIALDRLRMKDEAKKARDEAIRLNLSSATT